jgi:hypothetical protein
MTGGWRAPLAFLAALAAAASMLVACGDSGVGPASRFDVEFREPSPGQVRISSPSAVGAGLVSMHLRNTGTSLHQAQLLRVVGEHSRDEVLEVLRARDQRAAPIPSWIRDGGGAAVPAGERVTVKQRLRDGDWYLVDTQRPDGPDDAAPFYERGGLVAFTVTSGGSDADLPAADATITAREYEFRARGLQPGSQTVRFQNRGRQLHHLVAVPLRAGRTFDEAKAYFSTPTPNTNVPAPVDLASGVTLSMIDRGVSLVTEVTLPRGTYVLACFVTDRSGGPPHVNKGMLQEVRVGR